MHTIPASLYEFKFIDLTPIISKLNPGDTFYLRDEYFFTYKKINITRCKLNDSGLNIQKTNINDLDINNVYFLRGSTFDRQFFRRTYPNIKIRTEPKYADVILYDDRSLKKNSKSPIEYSLLSDKDAEDIKLYKNTENYYTLKSFSHFLFKALDGTISFSRSIAPYSWYHNNSYRDNFSNNEPLKELFRNNGFRQDIKYELDADINNTSVLRGIHSSLCTSSGYIHLKSGQMDVIYDKPVNDYYDLLNSLNKPFVKISDFFQNQKSSIDANDLSLDACISIWNQLKSSDEKVFMAAAESLVSYNAKKYIPIQSLFLRLSNINFSYFLKSKKIKFFLDSYVEWFICQQSYTFIYKQNVHNITNSVYVNSPFSTQIDDWENVCENYYNNNKDVCDIELLKQLLYNTTILTDYLGITLGQNKRGFDVNNFRIFKYIAVKNIDWSFNSKFLKNDNYNDNDDHENLAIPVTSESIDNEFGV